MYTCECEAIAQVVAYVCESPVESARYIPDLVVMNVVREELDNVVVIYLFISFFGSLSPSFLCLMNANPIERLNIYLCERYCVASVGCVSLNITVRSK